MRLLTFAAAALLAAGAAQAAPAHVSLRAASAASADAEGFLTLSGVAAITGGTPALRVKLAAVRVGRAPLAGDTRHLTRGDLRLKLRQAGLRPDVDAVIDGAPAADVTLADAAPVPASPISPTAPPIRPTALPAPNPAPAAIVLRRNTPVTIRIQEDDLLITARGFAREDGAAGQAIRIHRDGVPNDLTATVIDAQTVQMELSE